MELMEIVMKGSRIKSLIILFFIFSTTFIILIANDNLVFCQRIFFSDSKEPKKKSITKAYYISKEKIKKLGCSPKDFYKFDPSIYLEKINEIENGAEVEITNLEFNFIFQTSEFNQEPYDLSYCTIIYKRNLILTNDNSKTTDDAVIFFPDHTPCEFNLEKKPPEILDKTLSELKLENIIEKSQMNISEKLHFESQLYDDKKAKYKFEFFCDSKNINQTDLKNIYLKKDLIANILQNAEQLVLSNKLFKEASNKTLVLQQFYFNCHLEYNNKYWYYLVEYQFKVKNEEWLIHIITFTDGQSFGPIIFKRKS